MLDCLVLGDSIAVGVGQARPGCHTVARTGITSGAFMQSLFPAAPRAADRVVISLGVNDDPSMATADTLRQLRRSVQAREVVWLLPGLKPEVRQAIRTVAGEHGDRMLDTAPQAGPDHLHPSGDGYRLLAKELDGRTMPATAPVPALPAGTRLAMAPRGTGGLNLSAGLRVGTGQVFGIIPSQSGLPLVHVPGQGKQWQPMVPGGVYGAWPPAGATFAAVPPRSYNFGAIPVTR